MGRVHLNIDLTREAALRFQDTQPIQPHLPALAKATLLVLIATALPSCQKAQPAPATTPTAMDEKTPLVFVPGVTGSKLRDAKTRRTVFGRGVNVLVPHDGGYSIALPVTEGGGARLEAFAVVDQVSFGFTTVEVFGPLIELLEATGYRVGDIEAPRATDTLFPFPYDWRQDSVESAHLLAERLARVRRARGGGQLRVALICQSTGAHVCRYLVKYGGAPLEEATSGRAGPLPWLEVTRLILIATSNGGSLRTLRELDRGRRYVRLYGRVLRAEVFFTFRSLYQDLPCWRRDLFVDPSGKRLEVDLCDVASWEQYGWSAYGKDAARRIARSGRSDLFGSEEDRRSYLREVLDRSKRFQDLLHRDVVGLGPTLYFLIQDASRDTPERGVLAKKDGEWRTLFTGDREVDRQPALHGRVISMGDGHATKRSQLWLSPQEEAALATAPIYVEGGHFELIHAPETRRHLTEILGEDRWR